MYESSRKGLAMHGTRHAVVVTHTRLRESGTVVEEAVEQLRRADFEVTIIDNIEAPDFGSKTPVVPKTRKSWSCLAGTVPFCARPNWFIALKCPSSA